MKAVTTTGTAVNRSKNEVWLSKRGNNLGVCVFPCTSAKIANPQHMPTNATARRVDTAELYFKDSISSKTPKAKTHVSYGTLQFQIQETLQRIKLVTLTYTFVQYQWKHDEDQSKEKSKLPRIPPMNTKPLLQNTQMHFPSILLSR